MGRVRVPSERPVLEYFIAAGGAEDSIPDDGIDCRVIVNTDQHTLSIAVERHDSDLPRNVDL